MNFTKQINRLEKMHRLIKAMCTGKPDDFAEKLDISRRQLYNELDFFKSQDAPIKYSREMESFYYSGFFELEINLSIKVLKEDEQLEIYAGSSSPIHGVTCEVYNNWLNQHSRVAFEVTP